MRSLAVVLALFSPAALAAAMTPKQIYMQRGPGVVLILATDGGGGASSGTGSIIRADGLVLTNWHVISTEDHRRALKEIHVFLKPEKVVGDPQRDLKAHYLADVVAHDAALDLALIKIRKAPQNLTVLELGDPEELTPGDATVAIGHPEQGGLWTLTTGTIGARIDNFGNTPGKHVFQMETSLNRGNSGGPLFDVRGYIVGVNTMIARVGQGGLAITGVNFAVRSSVAKEWMEKQGQPIAYGPMTLAEAVPELYAAAPAPSAPVAAAPAAPAAPAAEPAAPASEVAVPTGPSAGQMVSGKTAMPLGAESPRKKGASPPPPAGPAKEQPAWVEHGMGKPTRLPSRRMQMTMDFTQPSFRFSAKEIAAAIAEVHKHSAEAFDELDAEVQMRAQ